MYSSAKRAESAAKLRSCYQTCLELAREHQLKTLAFNCISTGVYGYPVRDATEIALQTTRDFLASPNGREVRVGPPLS